MRLDPIQGTLTPEKVTCLAARGDYYDSYIGEDDFETVMEPIEGDTIEEKKKYLIHDLLDRGHYGPFEHPSMTIAVKGLSRSAMAQITRHRHVSFDVQSMRYVTFDEDEPEDAAVTPRSLTDPEHFSRETGSVDVNDEVRQDLEQEYLELVEQCQDFYQAAVEAGVPKEDARFGLPIGTPVNLTMTMNLRTMLHVVNMRGKGDAQWEIRELTDMVESVGRHWAPLTFEWYDEKGPLKEGL